MKPGLHRHWKPFCTFLHRPPWRHGFVPLERLHSSTSWARKPEKKNGVRSSTETGMWVSDGLYSLQAPCSCFPLYGWHHNLLDPLPLPLRAALQLASPPPYPFDVGHHKLQVPSLPFGGWHHNLQVPLPTPLMLGITSYKSPPSPLVDDITTCKSPSLPLWRWASQVTSPLPPFWWMTSRTTCTSPLPPPLTDGITPRMSPFLTPCELYHKLHEPLPRSPLRMTS